MEETTTNKKTGKAGRTFFIIMLVAIVLIAGIAAISIILSGKSADKERKRQANADMTASVEIADAKEYNEKGQLLAKIKEKHDGTNHYD